jgi:hypothetical protein
MNRKQLIAAAEASDKHTVEWRGISAIIKTPPNRLVYVAPGRDGFTEDWRREPMTIKRAAEYLALGGAA